MTCIQPNFSLRLGPRASQNATRRARISSKVTLRIICAANSLGHSTWTSNQPTSSGIADSHMLDVIVCSALLHKRIHNCCTILDGLYSDHCAVRMDLNLMSIKYKAKMSMYCGDTDWRKICGEDEQQKLYNKYLLKLTSWDMSYNNFCKVVVCAGKETAIAINRKCKG
jgi:hypothetical protein